MKQQLQDGAEEARRFAKSRPSETTWTVVGLALGVFVGFSLSGIGIAMLGGVFGLYGFSLPLVLAIVLGLVGNRFGIDRDRRRESIRLKALL